MYSFLSNHQHSWKLHDYGLIAWHHRCDCTVIALLSKGEEVALSNKQVCSTQLAPAAAQCLLYLQLVRIIHQRLLRPAPPGLVRSSCQQEK